MMRGGVHHIDLTVKDASVSRPFYEAVLGFMGYQLSTIYPDGYCDFDLNGTRFCSIGIRGESGPNAGRRHDRYTPGLHHLAWNAESRDDVDALHALLQHIGANVLDPPADYPQYGAGYYAVFFADPDGLKLEYVFKPCGAAGGRVEAAFPLRWADARFSPIAAVCLAESTTSVYQRQRGP